MNVVDVHVEACLSWRESPNSTYGSHLHLVASALELTILLTTTSSNARSSPPPAARRKAELSDGSGAEMSLNAEASFSLPCTSDGETIINAP